MFPSVLEGAKEPAGQGAHWPTSVSKTSPMLQGIGLPISTLIVRGGNVVSLPQCAAGAVSSSPAFTETVHRIGALHRGQSTSS